MINESHAALSRADKIIAEYRRAEEAMGMAGDALIEEAKRK